MSKAIINENLIKIDLDFESFIPSLTEDERTQLEQNILREGIKDPLVLGKFPELAGYFIIDGHNRYSIAKRHNIPFQYIVKDFQSKEEAKQWMIEHQLGRRNLNDIQRIYLLGLRYNSNKRDRGGKEQTGNIAEELATKTQTSQSTIKRAGKTAKNIEEIKKNNPKLAQELLEKNVESSIINKAVKELAPLQIKVRKDVEDLKNILQSFEEDKPSKVQSEPLSSEEFSYKSKFTDLKLNSEATIKNIDKERNEYKYEVIKLKEELIFLENKLKRTIDALQEKVKEKSQNIIIASQEYHEMKEKMQKQIDKLTKENETLSKTSKVQNEPLKKESLPFAKKADLVKDGYNVFEIDDEDNTLIKITLSVDGQITCLAREVFQTYPSLSKLRKAIKELESNKKNLVFK